LVIGRGLYVTSAKIAVLELPVSV